MADTPKTKQRPTGERMGILRRLRAEIVFSGESLRINGRGMLFGLLTGLVVGGCGSAFVHLLALAEQLRNETQWAALLLPIVGLLIVWMYKKGGIRTAGGTDLIIQAARGEQPVSRVLAPVIFLSTLLTHAFGGSAGREGAALQLGGSLAELIRKALRIDGSFEDLAIMCGMSAGFSAVFGNQISAVIFALEISCVGMLPLGALFPCVISSITAGTVARYLGVRGVALATIIAQGVSAVLVLIVLLRYNSCIRLIPKQLAIHWDLLRRILKVGLPAALQMAVTAFSNIFVTGYIYHFGADCMSGWTAYTKIDQIMFLPMQSLALSATTFVGQNLGHGDADRAHRGTRTALLLSLGMTAVLMVPVILFAPQLTAFFNAKPEVVAFGTLMLRYISPLYLLCCINQVYSGALRGAGDSRAPMVMMLSSFVVFRQIYLYVMSHYISNTLLPIIMSYPAGWLLCSMMTLAYYHLVASRRKTLDL